MQSYFGERIQKFKKPCKVNPTCAVTTEIRRQKEEKGERDVRGGKRGEEAERDRLILYA